MPETKRLFLIDGSHALFRAFHAIRELRNSKGFPTNAIYGFTNMLVKIVKDHSPDYLVVCFDLPGPTFRDEMYEEYKATRPPTPDELVVQIPEVKEMISAFNIPLIEKSGFEADDLIGTLSRRAEAEGLEVVIVTGDKDMSQLVSERVTMLDTMKDRVTGVTEVQERFGVGPEGVPDFLGLTGDKSDNIPGVPGIGNKTARDLLERFGSMDSILADPSKVERKVVRERLAAHADQAKLSRDLATIRCDVDLADSDVDLSKDLEALAARAPDAARLGELFTTYEFTRLLAEFGQKKQAISYDDYHTVTDAAELEAVIAGIREAGAFAVDLETTSVDSMVAEIVGISLSYREHQAFYIPVAHRYLGAPAQLDRNSVLGKLRPLLEDPEIPVYAQNIKYEYVIFKRYGIELQNMACDTMIASYLLNPSRHSHSLDEIAREHLGHTMISYKDVAGSGKKQIPFDEVDVKSATTYSCEDADVTFLLAGMLGERIRQEPSLESLFREMEMPLVEVLAGMEMNGVKIDVSFLRALAAEFRSGLGGLAERIYEEAGEQFNINSPQQLGRLLFEKLGYPGAKRTKTGYSTDVKVLTRLAASGYELPALVLEYRSFGKLISTYVEALPKLVHPETGRIHTSYNQTVTATGRLSSSNPNLQNIPIRTREGRRIREAFVPEEGSVLVSADYSQVELRVLAHVSSDESLVEAFRCDEDIHARTAREVFGDVEAEGSEEMSADLRRRAKAINFGVIYGMGAFGLAEQLGINRKEAQAYIDHYFQTYQGVKTWRDATLEAARENGYVETLMGRRRYLPEIASGEVNVRNFAERTAVNTPIQGAAADLIKKAMLSIAQRLRSMGLGARMIMQVHDELVFEVPAGEEESLKEMVREEMEGAVELDVPLKVDMASGRNWNEAH